MYDLFLFYASHPFRDDPKNLIQFIDKIDEELDISLQKNPIFEGCKDMPIPSLSGILKNVAHYILKWNELDLNHAYGDKEIQRTMTGYPNKEMEIAFEAVFGYHDYCIIPEPNVLDCFMDGCADFNPSIKSDLDPDIFYEYFQGPNRLRCYECQQYYFIRILDQIIEGKEFDEIAGLRDFLQMAPDYLIHSVVVSESPIPSSQFKKAIQLKLEFKYLFSPNSSSWAKGRDPEFPYKHVFNDIVRSCVAYSLGDFLVHGDRTKLKRCLKCETFLIADRKTKKFCTDNCRLNYHSKVNITSGEAKKFKREKYGWKGRPPTETG